MDDPLPPLNSEEVRVLGCLIEKQITTPDYYPLSLNALTNACNQLSNREPVVSYDETTIVRAIERLREKRLASLFSGQESRVSKYKHALTDRLSLTPAEVAVLTVLMLRGPQTVGELRGRTERLFTFDSLPEVEETLGALASRQPQALVAKLPRQPGTKESRYTQLFGGPVDIASASQPVETPAVQSAVAPASDRVTQLEAEVAQLARELADLRQQFEAFRKQLE
jgi:uncharacterized protein YceH (UPF0502 family)